MLEHQRNALISKFLHLTKERTTLLNKVQFPTTPNPTRYVDPVSKYMLSRIDSANEPKIIIAMSSGVDSSVCAGLFKLLGFNNIQGVYMQNWGGAASADGEEGKCWEKDWRDVQGLGKFLDIPVEKVDFQKEYWCDVFQPMVESYEHGTTPNPDLGCNKYIKFGKLVHYLDQEYENYYLVTGHYSRIMYSVLNSVRKPALFKAFDSTKDQSYYLSQIDGAKVLRKVLFPLGNLKKSEVREIANMMTLPTAAKKDSQGICFVQNSQSKGNFTKFLANYTTEESGNIVSFENGDTTKKHVWGKHKGMWSYTIGQRIRIPIPQIEPFKGQWFVSRKLKETNEIVIVKGKDHPSLFRDTVLIKDFQFMNADETDECDFSLSELEKRIDDKSRQNLNIKYRSLHSEPIKVLSLDRFMTLNDEKRDVIVKLKLETSQRAITPGQYCCLYDEAKVIGCGTIMEGE